MTAGPRLAAAAAGIVLDRAFGEPPAAVHPVALFGRAMAAAERVTYRDSRAAGIAHAAVGTAVAAGSGAMLARIGGRRSAAGGAANSDAAEETAKSGTAGDADGSDIAGRVGKSNSVGAIALAAAVAVAGRSLTATATSIADALHHDDLDRARVLLPSLVGRDPAGLDAGELARAVVESVAENTVDAVVAPALWAAAAGAPGTLAYRAINTLDAMVGHRSARYRRFGWASARLDDVAGYLPARVTAGLVAALRPRAAAAVWRAVRTQAPAHPSPNSGVAEAAFAAALGLRLGGRNRYGDRIEDRPALGCGRPATAADIGAATRLSGDVGLALAGLLFGAGWLAGARKPVGTNGPASTDRSAAVDGPAGRDGPAPGPAGESGPGSGGRSGAGRAGKSDTAGGAGKSDTAGRAGKSATPGARKRRPR